MTPACTCVQRFCGDSSMGKAVKVSLALALAACLAVANAGEVTTSRPFLIDSQVVDMQWVNSTKKDAGPHDKTVFVRSARGSIYRSTDDGLNWASQHEKMVEDEDEEPFASRVQQMHFSQADPNFAVMQGFADFSWYTKDQGQTFSRHAFGPAVELKMHPTQPKMLLASRYEGEFPHRSLSLFISEDFGKEWKKIASNIFQFQWADPEMKGRTDKTILACMRRADIEPKTAFTSWDPNIDFVISDDLFATQRTVVEHGNRFAVHPPYWFVASMNPDEELEVRMAVSSDRGATFSTSHFPYKLSEKSYRVVDSKESSVFVQVTHSDRDMMFANVYLSGADGRLYSLSLRHVIKDFKGMSDFERINGVDGVYVANVADMDAEPTMTLAGGLQAIFGASSDGMIPSKSLITFDKGALWEPIRAPKKDSRGHLIRCEKCSLHLNGKTSHQFGPVYSSPSSTGLIMATGNVGHHLHSRPDEVNTYFSRDAGRNWEEILKGSYIYEYGDHGALMVLADNTKASREVIYSWNEGLNWTHFEFWDHAIEVENIIIEPSGTSQIFILYGRRHDKGVLMQLNFETLHQRRCLGVNAPGSDTSDYEEWIPSDELREGKCLLGRKVTYTRRKRDARCFNGHDYDHKQRSRSCQCLRTDFECDFGYQLTEKKTCERVPDMPVSGFGAPEGCSGFFTVTRGYRKVPGDFCEGGGGEWEPTRQGCPGIFSGTGAVVVLVVCSLAVVMAVFTYYQGKDVRGGMNNMTMPTMNFQKVGDALDFIKEGGRSVFSGGGGRGGYRGLGTEMDDDDFGLGDYDDEAQVLGESLAEYANLTPSRAPGGAPAISGQQPNDDLIDLEEGTGGAAGGGGGAAGRMSTPPKSLPTAPVPKLEGPPK